MLVKFSFRLDPNLVLLIQKRVLTFSSIFDLFQVLPPSFLQEHGDKFEEYVIFRTRSSAKPWVVQVSIFEEPHALVVKFAGGWEEFAADKSLKQGDSLIFVLKVPLPEFMVYIFRETGMSSSSRASARNSFNTDHCTRVSEQAVRSLSHGRREEQQKNFRKTGDLLIEKKKAVQEVINSAHDSLHSLHLCKLSGKSSFLSFQVHVYSLDYRMLELVAKIHKSSCGLHCSQSAEAAKPGR